MADTPRNSMLNWYPRIESLDIPTPDTVFVPYEVLDEPDPLPVGWDNDEIHDAVQEVGGYPAFAKADQVAWKENLEIASKINSREDIELTLLRLLDHALSHKYTVATIVIREFLDIDHYFDYHGQKIGPEVRFFIGEGDVLCHHFYWPDKKFTDEEDHSDDLSTMHQIVEDTLETTTEYAEQVANEFTGYWSVDFAYTTSGDWYLIDMAQAYESEDGTPGSWHPNSCEYSKPPSAVKEVS